MTFLEFNKKLYDKLGLLTMTKGALVLLAIWAFLEASIWFVAPDFILLILCILSPKRYKKFFIFGFLFSIIGIIVYLLLISQYPDISYRILINTPLVSQRMMDAINLLYNQDGVLAVLKQSTTFISVKVWTFQAVAHHFNPFIYVSLVAISRAIRMFLTCFIFSFIGRKYKTNIRNNTFILLLAYVLLFSIVLYKLESI